MHTWSSPFDGLQSTLICRLHVLLVSVTNSSIKQCHIICMTSYAWQHISNTADYVILVAMGLTHTHPMLAWHYSMYGHESTHLTSAIPSLQSLLHTVKMYKPLSFLIATSWLCKEFKRNLCQSQRMVKAVSAVECYSWLYEGCGGKINMSFAWT